DLNKALDLAQRARLALPKTANVSDTLGWVYYKRDLYGSALPLFQEAVRQDPNRAIFHFHLAAALVRTGKLDQAREELNSAFRLDSSLRQRGDVQQLLDVM